MRDPGNEFGTQPSASVTKHEVNSAILFECFMNQEAQTRTRAPELSVRWLDEIIFAVGRRLTISREGEIFVSPVYV